MEAKPNTDKLFYLGALGLSLIGLVIAGYLTYNKWFPANFLCTGAGDCEAVNTSIYSEVAGIPVALLGALAYATLLGLLLLEPRLSMAGEWGPLAGFGVAFAGVLFSAYLTYIEIAVIHKICPYCVTSAIVITLICVLEGVRVYRKWLSE